MAKKKEALSLLKEILESIDLIGVEGTIYNIRSGSKLSKHKKEDTSFVVGKTCIYFKVTQNELIFGTSRGERIDARDTCVYLLNKLVGMPCSDINKLFYDKLNIRNMYRAVKRVDNLDARNKADVVLIEKISLIKNDFLNRDKP